MSSCDHGGTPGRPRFPLSAKLEQMRLQGSADDGILDHFLDDVSEAGLELYPAQEEAILELSAGNNVILATPTGSGKSLVASYLHFQSLAQGRRSVYTSPIKALVNDKFQALLADFGPQWVGMVTGDVTIHPDAPILCCTAEILSHLALRQGSAARVDDVIMDEFHYYGDSQRGMAWQVPLLTLPQARFLLMSATLGETERFEKALTRLNQKTTTVVSSQLRPVPLSFEYSETLLQDTVVKCVSLGRAPIYLIHFTQKECAEAAQNFLSIDFCSKPEKLALQAALEGVSFNSPYGREIQKLVRHGIGLHHAGLLPKYRILVERLAKKGLLKLICGTDTLGVGVNVPIKTVIFTKLVKFDGKKLGILTQRDFHQMSGRAGRKGFDEQGYVLAQAPEHVIENLRLEQKAAAAPSSAKKKWVKKKPPAQGYVGWSRETFLKLMEGQPEPLKSHFVINHAVLLQVLGRTHEDGCQALRRLIRQSHEPDDTKRKLRKTAFELFRSLVDRKIVLLNPLAIHGDLQNDFSLNHALGLYVIDTLKLLDPQVPEYVFQLLTLVEAILENPEAILRRQLDRVKKEAMEAMKAEGLDFESRVAKLEELEYPKPHREFIYQTFNEFAALHPWVGAELIRPKSIVREMFETFQTFAEYVRDYRLERVEGLLLRYLMETYHVLNQTVPESAKGPEVYELENYLKTTIKQVDSTLLEEWEQLRQKAGLPPDQQAPAALEPLPPQAPSWEQRPESVRQTRNLIFRFLKRLAQKEESEYQAALELLQVQGHSLQQAWNTKRLREVLEDYYADDHEVLCTDAKARDPQFTRIDRRHQAQTTTPAATVIWQALHEAAGLAAPCEGDWRIEQILVDPAGYNDWSVIFSLDLAASRDLQAPVLRLLAVARLSL